MQIDQKILDILVCPETQQKLSLASKEIIATLNKKSANDTLYNRAHKKISQPIEGGLIRSDQKIVYPVHAGIPLLIIEEGIEV